jgi:anti-sigma regulatory factor (Ser/Thr protein kinase)
METITLPDNCHQQVRIDTAPDLLVARHVAGLLCAGTGLTATQQERVNLIITELGNNLLRHAAGGAFLLRRLDGRTGVECICWDRGPGIGDLGAALHDGHTGDAAFGSSLGVGLGAVRRMSDEFDIHSEAAIGTAVLSRVRRAAADRPAPPFQFGAVMLPMAGMKHCGDGWVVMKQGLVAVIDGLGHGGEASIAARRAELSIPFDEDDPPRVINAMHAALRGTRGAVAMVAHMAEDGVHFCGVGNIAGAVIGIDRISRLHSAWGVVGSRITPPAVHRIGWQSGDVLLLHSDGVARATDAFAARYLRYIDPTLACAIILRDAATKLDDQTVVIVRR